MNYEIDREISNEPSLAEMALKAIKILDEATADSEQGFFLMIEGSRIGTPLPPIDAKINHSGE